MVLAAASVPGPITHNLPGALRFCPGRVRVLDIWAGVA